MTDAEIETWVWNAIRKTINKFREQPYYFFTESDIVSYLWMSLYTSNLEVKKDEKIFYLVHREYPTNFRYDKTNLLKMDKPYSLQGELSTAEAIAAEKIDLQEELQQSEDISTQSPNPLLMKIGSRGHYDLVILSPEFVRSASVLDIVNKHMQSLEIRQDPTKIELVFAIEFKYIINNSYAWKKQIEIDNKKLFFAKKYGNAQHVVNLVFCNTNTIYEKDVKEAIGSAQTGVSAAFIQSYYDEDGKKNTPRPYPNTAEAARLIGYPEKV